MTTTGRKCIECGADTVAIQIIDRGNQNIEYELTYTAGDSKRSVFKGHKKKGNVGSELCENCGRITLRALANN